eukprot:3269395-Pleurochrysis_carterae.AAC.1
MPSRPIAFARCSERIGGPSDGCAAVVADMRMGFGGAFAPNRFERLLTLVAAWAQRRQAQFDVAQQPPEASAWLWARARAEAGLRSDAVQLAP